MAEKQKHIFLLAAMSVLLALFFFANILLGSVRISPHDVFLALRGEASATINQIVVDFRLPKAITAILAGAALSVCGLQMQTIFRNPLSGPDVLG
ncbi:MAG TPA: iron chelate uptake ABC transporter family permease subunit, partial [Prolixibacteraceae bacterium]|nr:iron chelate uptake ABC transporter family permease subunit [Prolixibacteraceae bacterium]